jgi:hypothetical protein
MQSIIARAGHGIQYVTADPGEANWAYTIGRARKGLPELVVTGVSQEGAAHMLNELVREWDRMEIAGDGLCTIPGPHRHQCRFAEVPESVWRSNYLLGARRDAEEQGLGASRVAVQALWRSDRGQYPDDPAAPMSFRRTQPILGKLFSTRHPRR